MKCLRNYENPFSRLSSWLGLYGVNHIDPASLAIVAAAPAQEQERQRAWMELTKLRHNLELIDAEIILGDAKPEDKKASGFQMINVDLIRVRVFVWVK